jgi:type I restriction enzyme, R subunit
MRTLTQQSGPEARRKRESSIYHLDEVERVARVFFTGKETRTQAEEARLQGRLHPYLDAAVRRFGDLDPAEQEEFRGQLVAYRNLYSFLSQVIPYQDSDLEKLYVFVRFRLTSVTRFAEITTRETSLVL